MARWGYPAIISSFVNKVKGDASQKARYITYLRIEDYPQDAHWCPFLAYCMRSEANCILRLVNRNEITHTLAERLVLAQVNSPFIVPLKFSFQSEQKLYLVLAYVIMRSSFLNSDSLSLHPALSMAENSFTISNGSSGLTRSAPGKFFHSYLLTSSFNWPSQFRFYSAELLLALEHLHELDVVYR